MNSISKESQFETCNYSKPSDDLAAKVPATAIILTFNEAVNIDACVRNLHNFDEVVVVDSGSTDETLDILRRNHPKVRILKNKFENFGQQRNWAIENTEPRNKWILFIDADEFMEPALTDEIRDFITSPGTAVGAYIAGRNYFLGRWIKHSTYYPVFQLRLLKRGQVTYQKEGHGQREVTSGKVAYLKSTWRHEGFSKGIESWVSRHNRYSSDEIDLILKLRKAPLKMSEFLTRDRVARRRALKKLGARLPFRPFGKFFYGYFCCRGFLDGYPGLLYNLLRFAHEIHVVAKMHEQRRKSDAESGTFC